MAISREDVDARVHAFRECCVERNVKVTHQRLEIYRVLASSEEHPDAETIQGRVRKRIPTISPDTVYRNLKLLAEHGLVSIVGMSHERLRFDANMASHHHFVCLKCGKIRDFYSRRLDGLKTPEEACVFGEAVSVHVEVKGVCNGCRDKAARR